MNISELKLGTHYVIWEPLDAKLNFRAKVVKVLEISSVNIQELKMGSTYTRVDNTALIEDVITDETERVHVSVISPLKTLVDVHLHTIGSVRNPSPEHSKLLALFERIVRDGKSDVHLVEELKKILEK